MDGEGTEMQAGVKVAVSLWHGGQAEQEQEVFPITEAQPRGRWLEKERGWGWPCPLSSCPPVGLRGPCWPGSSSQSGSLTLAAVEPCQGLASLRAGSGEGSSMAPGWLCPFGAHRTSRGWGCPQRLPAAVQLCPGHTEPCVCDSDIGGPAAWDRGQGGSHI